MRTERPQPPSARTEPAFLDRPAPPRSGASEVLFHIGGVVVLLVAAGIAFVFAALISWGHSVCNADVTDPAFVDPLRRDLMLIVLALAAVAALWALLAKVAKLAWVPWAIVSGTIFVGGAVVILPLREVSRWCF